MDFDATSLLNSWKEIIWFLEHGNDWYQKVDISEFLCFIHDFVILSHIQPKSSQNTTDEIHVSSKVVVHVDEISMAQ